MKTVQQDAAITLLQQGAIGVIPTDTVYGVAAAASQPAAIDALYQLKNRHKQPGTIIAADIAQLVALGIAKRYVTTVEQYWPNPISVIVPAPPKLAYLHGGLGTLAVRIPSDAALQKIVQTTGPLMTSSANMPAQPPAQTLAEAYAYFQDGVDFYLDGGTLVDRQPSTIIQVVDDAVVVLRHGAVTIDEETGAIL